MTDTIKTTTTTLTPHISCRKASEAVEFYQKAFGAELLSAMHTPDGRVMHAALKFGESMLYLVDEFPEHGGQSPQSLGGSPVTLHLQVPDCDAVWARAVEAGCMEAMPLQEMFWGDRWGMLTDPYGHQWSVATTVKQLSPEEMQKAMLESTGCGEVIK